jgi:hypothetical protein
MKTLDLECAINKKMGCFDFKKFDYKKFADESITLTDEQMELLKNTIVSNLDYPDFTVGFNALTTSNQFKRLFTKILGFNVSNMDFKEAMKQIGIPNNGKMIDISVSYPIRERTCKKLWKKVFI